MSGPDINPLAAKLLGGRQGRDKLRDQLLRAAEETDDQAYAQRLREAADGKRPLRTLMSDPAFLAAHGGLGARGRAAEEALATAPQANGSPEQVREHARSKLTAMGIEIPTAEEGAAIFDEVIALQQRAAAIVAQDRLRGWDGSEQRVADEVAKEKPEE